MKGYPIFLLDRLLDKKEVDAHRLKIERKKEEAPFPNEEESWAPQWGQAKQRDGERV